MELVERLVDEENEKILNMLDEALGLQKNKNILRDIIRYSKLAENSASKLNFNYNIIIRNASEYSFFETLIDIIKKLYYQNGIIHNKDICYFALDKFDEKKEINEDMVVIFFEGRHAGIEEKKKFDKIFKKFNQKVFIILEETSVEGDLNALLNEYVTWSMKIYGISTKEK